MTTTGRAPSAARLLAGPALLALGLVLLGVSNELGGVGPLDRAAFGWLVPVPMLLLAPGVAASAAQRGDRTPARRAIDLMGLGLGAVTFVALATGTRQLGCDPHPSTLAVLTASLPVPLVLGAGWALAGRAALRFADRPLAAVVVGALGAVGAAIAMLLTIGLLFPAAGCAYVPTPG
jgi:hypothetical protein